MNKDRLEGLRINELVSRINELGLRINELGLTKRVLIVFNYRHGGPKTSIYF